MDGVHFLCQEASPEDIANKVPRRQPCLLTLPQWVEFLSFVPCPYAYPRSLRKEFLERFIEKFTELCVPTTKVDSQQVEIPTTWSGPLVVSVTLWGRPHPKRVRLGVDGASPGDLIYVSGPLGGSPRGHHLTFTSRVGSLPDSSLTFALPAPVIDLVRWSWGPISSIFLIRSQVGATLDQQALHTTG